MIEWLHAVTSLVTLGGVAALIGLILHSSKEWKEARDARHQSELAEKDRLIKQLQADAYPAAAEASATMMKLVDLKDAALKDLKEVLQETQLSDKEKATLLERMESKLNSETHVLEAILNIGSENPSTKLRAARELLEIRDPRTIPALVQTMSRIGLTPTKMTVITALEEFGADAVPSLIDELRDHARLVSEAVDLPEDPQFAAWRGAVLDSDAGNLLVRIGEASIPPLRALRNNQGLLGEAADALLTAIAQRQQLTLSPKAGRNS